MPPPRFFAGLDVTVHSQDGSTKTTRPYQVIRIARNTVGNTSATVSESLDPSACVKARSTQSMRRLTGKRPKPTQCCLAVLGDAGGVDVGAQFLGKRVMAGPLVMLAAFLVQPELPAGVMRAKE